VSKHVAVVHKKHLQLVLGTRAVFRFLLIDSQIWFLFLRVGEEVRMVDGRLQGSQDMGTLQC